MRTGGTNRSSLGLVHAKMVVSGVRVGFSFQIGLAAMGHFSVVVKCADSGARQDSRPTLSPTSFVTQDKLLKSLVLSCHG